MTASVPLSVAPREEQVFPVLTPAQIARVEAHGKRRAVQRGEVLIEAGAQHYPMLVVVSGELEVVRTSCAGEELATTLIRLAWANVAPKRLVRGRNFCSTKV